MSRSETSLFAKRMQYAGKWCLYGLRLALYYIVVLASIGVLIGLDQLFKWLAVVHLKNQPPFVLIPNVFELHYNENPGAAFGILSDHRWVFISITIIVMVFLLVLLLSGRFKKYKLLNASAILIVAGGIGNLIDRIAYGYVVDFLYFKLINFPIFNFADCCVVIGSVMLLIFFFFFYEEKPKGRHKAADDAERAADNVGAEPVKEPEAHAEQCEGIDADNPGGKSGGTD